MKKLMMICCVCILTAGASWGAIVTLDENGHGAWNGVPLTWGIGAVPVTPITPQLIYTLYYDLPFGVVEGDLQAIEPDGTVSDVLRFINTPGTAVSRVYVYSDRDPLSNDTDLADSVIPWAWINVVTVPETGPEGGWNGVIWTPGFNDPGATSAPITYEFTSDIPEPATICMFGLGTLALLRERWRRQFEAVLDEKNVTVQ